MSTEPAPEEFSCQASCESGCQDSSEVVTDQELHDILLNNVLTTCSQSVQTASDGTEFLVKFQPLPVGAEVNLQPQTMAEPVLAAIRRFKESAVDAGLTPEQIRREMGNTSIS